MARLFEAVRTEERRDVAVAFLTLFALVGSHAVLETARDALFLSRIPSSRLPIVYIAIAAGLGGGSPRYVPAAVAPEIKIPQAGQALDVFTSPDR